MGKGMDSESIERRLSRLEEDFTLIRGRQDFSDNKLEEILKWKPLVDSTLNDIRNEIED
jgi:hypothetical protein